MLVTMTTNIGGHRNGEPWPTKGGTIDLPVPEALDLIGAGYAAAADPAQALAIVLGAAPDTAPTSPAPFDVAKATKRQLAELAADRGLDVDVKLPVKELRQAVATALEATADETHPTEPDTDTIGPGDGTWPDPGSGEEAVEVGLDDLDKGQLLDLAADLNVSVNPALDAEEIRAVLADAGVMGQLVVDDPDLPPAEPLEA
jgi:hypothetical protein